MLIVFLKSIFVFILVLVVIRLMGKRQLGEMQPFELVITLIIAEVACIPMNDPHIPFYAGIIPIVTLGMLGVLLSFISRKSIAARKLISGKCVIIIDKDGINFENLKRLNMNVNDLIEAIHSSGYIDIAQIQYAILETNGKLCVVEKTADPTKPVAALYPLEIVADGHYHKKNLEITGTDISEFEKVIKQSNYNINDVLYADVRQNGDVYISPKHGSDFVVQMNITGGRSW